MATKLHLNSSRALAATALDWIHKRVSSFNLRGSWTFRLFAASCFVVRSKSNACEWFAVSVTTLTNRSAVALVTEWDARHTRSAACNAAACNAAACNAAACNAAACNAAACNAAACNAAACNAGVDANQRTWTWKYMRPSRGSKQWSERNFKPDSAHVR